MLQDLQRSELSGPGGLLRAGVNHTEPGDRLVLLVPALFSRHFDKLAGSVCWEQAPALVALNQGVPGARAERVNVNACSGAAGTHHKPPGGE